MNAEELQALQKPLKQAYRDAPHSALATLRAEVVLRQEELACPVITGLAQPVAGLHPAAGGDGSKSCPGDMLLEALASCAGVTFMAVATALGVTLHKSVVHAEGDMDFRGTLGVSKEVPVGFTDIRLRFEVESNATAEQLATLMRLSERYCVVYQTLAHPPKLSLSMNG